MNSEDKKVSLKRANIRYCDIWWNIYLGWGRVVFGGVSMVGVFGRAYLWWGVFGGASMIGDNFKHGLDWRFNSTWGLQTDWISSQVYAWICMWIATLFFQFWSAFNYIQLDFILTLNFSSHSIARDYQRFHSNVCYLYTWKNDPNWNAIQLVARTLYVHVHRVYSTWFYNNCFHRFCFKVQWFKNPTPDALSGLHSSRPLQV